MRSALTTLLCVALAACEPLGNPVEPEASQSPGAPVPLPAGLPADTVMLVEGEPITASEIDAWVETYRLVEPAKTIHAQRRFILTNQILPRAVCRILEPELRLEARSKVERAREHLVANGEANETYEVRRIHDDWISELGIDRWGIARDTEQDALSEVFEGPGYFTFVRRVASPDPEDWNVYTEATIEHVTEYYIEPEYMKEIVESALHQVRIEIVDPEWRRYLPSHYFYLTPEDSQGESTTQ